MITILDLIPKEILHLISYNKDTKVLTICTKVSLDNLKELEEGIFEALPFIRVVNFEVKSDDELIEERSKKEKEMLETIHKSCPVFEQVPNVDRSIPSEQGNGNYPIFKKKSRNVFKKVSGPILNINEIYEYTDSGRDVCIKGTLSHFDTRVTKIENIEYKLYFYDEKSSITVKYFCNKNEVENFEKALKSNCTYKLKGKVQKNYYVKEHEFLLNAIEFIGEKARRRDNSTDKHIDLHIHSKKTALEGLMEVSEIFNTAKEWGLDTVSICDENSLHSFIEAHDLGIKHDIKVIYGLGSNIFNDSLPLIDSRATMGIDDTYVAVDIETTGLNVKEDKIIEIGAVKISKGKIVDSFNSLLYLDEELDVFTTELTGIKSEDLLGAEKPEVVMQKFLKFIGDAPLVAHNAPFDIPTIKFSFKRILDVDIDPIPIDTLLLSRIFLNKIHKFGLKRVASHLKIPLDSHHRAYDDALCCGKIFLHFLQLMKQKSIKRIVDIEKEVDSKEYHLNFDRMKNVLFLVKNQGGLKNLYRMFSHANLHYLQNNKPGFSYDLIEQNREGVLVGAAGLYNEIFDAYLNGKDPQKLYNFYDFIEILPYNAYMSYYQKGELISKKNYENIVKKIIEESPIKVVVSSYPMYFDKNDYIYRNIIQFAQPVRGLVEKEAGFNWLTTEELMEEFSFLSENTKREIIIDNPRELIKDFKDVIPFPNEKFPPKLENSAEILKELCQETAYKKYGNPLPEIVKTRLDYELSKIIDNGYAVLYIAAHKLVAESMSKGFLVGSRGSVGSSLAATMSGITEVNPLQAHYLCPDCKYTEFFGTEVDSCYDLPDKKCPCCGKELKKEGFNIPFESFMGFEGDKEPDIDLNFSPKIQSYIHRYTGDLFGHDYVFKAGTIGAIQENIAKGYIINYYEKNNMQLSNSDISRHTRPLIGVAKSTGQHPGGIIVVPSDMEIYDFTPVQYPANNKSKGVITTHFDYDAMKGKLLKLDILGHDDPSIIRYLQDITGIDPRSLPLDDPKVLSLFYETTSIGIDREDYSEEVASLGLPEFGTGFVRKMLQEIRPKSVSDIIRVSGLSHGKNVWVGNMQEIINSKIIDFKDVTSTREQIMLHCIDRGMQRNIAFKIMEDVRKGKGLKDEQKELMSKSGVEDWFIEACDKISYMFPKAHAVAYVMMALRIGWYKVYEPKAFYAAHFSTKIKEINAYKVLSESQVESSIELLKNSGDKKHQSEINCLELIREMYYRGIKFLPVDLYKSKASEFTVEEDGVRIPFQCVESLGEKVALLIESERDKDKFLSVEDLKQRTKISQKVIDSLTEMGCLENLPQSDQLSIFDLF